METYTVHFKSAKYGFYDIDNLEFLSDSDRDDYIEKIADEISKLGLTWVPKTSEVIGPIDLDPGMDDEEFAEWFDATCGKLWEEYWERH